MIVIVKKGRYTTITRFKHRFIRYYLYIIINWLKKCEIDILDEKDI